MARLPSVRSYMRRRFFEDTFKRRLSDHLCRLYRWPWRKRELERVLKRRLLSSMMPNKYLQARQMAWHGVQNYHAKVRLLPRRHPIFKAGYPLRNRGRSSNVYERG